GGAGDREIPKDRKVAGRLAAGLLLRAGEEDRDGVRQDVAFGIEGQLVVGLSRVGDAKEDPGGKVAYLDLGAAWDAGAFRPDDGPVPVVDLVVRAPLVDDLAVGAGDRLAVGMDGPAGKLGRRRVHKRYDFARHLLVRVRSGHELDG